MIALKYFLRKKDRYSQSASFIAHIQFSALQS